MEQSITLERRFAIIDEWLLDLKISDRAIRLYAVLARYADNQTHKAYPSRATLAERLHCSRASVDRAAQELVDAGAMTKEQRLNSSIIYTLRVSAPVSTGVITNDEGGSAPVMRGVLTGDDLTITTEREPKNKSSRATQMPEDYKPSDKFKERFSDLSIEDEFEAFCDYHLARGSRFKDWDRAFSTWCRNAVRFAKPKTVLHKQELKPAAEGPGRRAWVKSLHDQGEHWECKPGEFGCK
jgi:hypothetical protein